MPSVDEARRETARLEALLDGGVRRQLLAYPGVYHVAVGVKESRGSLTGELCFRVYVRQKAGEGDLPAGGVVPPEIAGVRTDVNVVPPRRPAMARPPVVGGSRITNGLVAVTPAGTGILYGTLGCIGRNRRDRSIVGLTNWHVLFVGGGTIGSKIHQPERALTPDTLQPTDANAIGIVGDGILSAAADAGVVKLDTSWCRSCGIDWRDEVRGLGVNRYDGISGIARAVPTEPVWLVGQATGSVVQGIVVTDNEADFPLDYHAVSDPRVSAPGGRLTQTFHGQITINPAGSTPFGQFGDSGGVVVNSHSEVVGLYFAHDDPPAVGASANHIADVIAALHTRGIDFDPNFTPVPNPSTPRRGATIAVPREISPPSAAWDRARERLAESPAGARVADAIAEHRREAVELVNRCRPVTVAWRRAQGPALMAHLLKTISEPGYRVPEQVEGATLDGLAERMGEAFASHGSPGLNAALRADGGAVLAAARGCRTFDEFAARLGEGEEP